MYESFYKFTGKPFQLTPDPGFFFKSKGHQRAMAYLRYGLQQGEGFIVITGDVGTGKTTLVNNLFRDIDKDRIVAAKIVSTNLADGDFIQLVASRFGIVSEDTSKGNLVNEIEKFLVNCHESGQRALLVVDEAQNLPVKSLEELRMLSNFEINNIPLLQSFLLGQREFRATLRSPGLEQLKQRVIAAYHLKSLSDLETREYIDHRLQKVGWTGNPEIEPDVYLGVYRFTRGIPRRINTLMDRLLLNASLDKEAKITLKNLNVIIEEVQQEQQELDEEFDEDGLPAAGGAEPAGRGAGVSGVSSQRIDALERQLSAIQHNLDSLSRQLADTRPRLTERDALERTQSARERRLGMMISAAVSVAVAAIVLVGYLVFTNVR